MLRRGAWSGALVAIGFGWLLTFAVSGALVWPDLMSQGQEQVVWGLIATISIAAAFLSRKYVGEPSEWDERENDAFRLATDQYLRGNWYDTERLLRTVLRRNPRDMEARLLLATALRHTERFEEAERELSVLQKNEDAWRWELEIARELSLLRRAREEAASETPSAGYAADDASRELDATTRSDLDDSTDSAA